MDRKKLLTAIDGSIHSSLVIDQSVEYARLLHADVVLVHCHKKFPTLLGEPQRNRQIASIISAAEELVKPFLQRFTNADIPCEPRLLEEPAAAMIIDVARLEGCDLIIMGSRGLGNLSGLILGSVTNKVLQGAPCSVLVVR